MYNITFDLFIIIESYQILIMCFVINQTAKSRGEDLLPVWRSVRPGSLQPQPCPLALPTGSLQEAAQGQTLTGRHEGVRPCHGRVRLTYILSLKCL